MSLPVWTYWEGPRPPVIDLCLETIRRHHPTIQVLDPQTFRALGGGHLLDQTAGALPQPRSDMVRFWLMAQFGGLWFDADVLALRPSGLPANLRGYEAAGFVSASARSQVFTIYHFAMQPGAVAADALQTCTSLFDGPAGDYRAPLQTALRDWWRQHRQHIHRPQAGHYEIIPRSRAAAFLAKGRDVDFRADQRRWRPSAYLYHLTGWPIYSVRSLSKEQLLASHTFLGFLFREALR